MEKDLLQMALNSILHGSTQVVSETDSYGNTVSREIRINDLRTPLVNKLAEKLVQTPEFKEALLRVFTPEVIKNIQENALANIKYSDLPYETKGKVERELKDIPVTVKRYKLIAEAVEEESTK